jgi:hypothetical protein
VKAFPLTKDMVVGSISHLDAQGMDLRDYFAAKGLEALMVSVTSELQSKHHLIEKANQIKKVYALMCYAMADAMMEARNESQ